MSINRESHYEHFNNYRSPMWTQPQSGMSLRDQFALQAITGMVFNTVFLNMAALEHTGVPVEEIAAKSAYKIADALLAERGRADV